MKFERMLTLREITAIKVATTLWSYMDRCRIMICVEEFRHPALCRSSSYRKLSRIEDEVKLKISEFEVPECLKKKVASFVRPIAMELFKWCKYHCLDGYLNIDPANEFCWTSRGTIDLKKTAEGWVRDNNLCLSTRYKLACIYCLEENITQLWYKMSESCRAIFCDRKQFGKQYKLVTFWTLFKRGEIARMKISSRKSPYQFAFESAVVSGNIVATKYFWEKLTPDEKNPSVLATLRDVVHKSHENYQRSLFEFPAEYYSEVLFFLLSQLEAEQQIKVFRHHALAVLKCLMLWPFHWVLRKTAFIILNYTSDFDYVTFLGIITQKVHAGHSYYNYSGLFTELWQKSPQTHKKYVASSPSVSHLIHMLLRNKDTMNVKLILQKMHYAEKKKYLCSEVGLIQCCRLMDRNEWGFLRMLVRRCLQRKEDIMEFNKKVIKEIGWHKNHMLLVRLLQRLSHQQ